MRPVSPKVSSTRHRKRPSTLALAAVVLALVCSGVAAQRPDQKPVVSIMRASAIRAYAENPTVVREMVDALVIAVTGRKTVADAWGSLVKPTDLVGLQVADEGAPLGAVRLSVIAAVKRGLIASGVPETRIVVHRGAKHLRDYDPEATFEGGVPGRLIAGDIDFSGKRGELSTRSHWARFISREATALISIPVLSSSEGCGIAGTLYNMTIPNLDNRRRFLGHPTYGDPYIAQLYSDPRIAPKVVFHLMDGLVAQFGGGPEFQPNYAWEHATLYASRDPVALDAVAAQRIEAWRADAQLPKLGARAAHVDAAAVLGLGRGGPLPELLCELP